MPDTDSYEATEPDALGEAHIGPEGFSWPTPPFAAYPAPQPQEQAEPVEIIAINGARSVGQLLRLLPGPRQVLLRLPSTPQALQVDWDELLSLRLLRPLRVPPALPLRVGGEDEAESDFDRRPRHGYRLRLRGGQVLQGQTIGHLEDELGLFLFLPLSPEDDSVHRLFVPREAIEHWDYGRRIAELPLDGGGLGVQPLPRGVDSSRADGPIVSPEQLLQALESQSRMPILRIGEALVAMHLISQQQLEAALEQQKHERGMPLGQLLVLRGWVTREQLQSALARKMGYPTVDVAHFPVELLALQRLPHAVARRLEVLPLLLREGRLIVAMEDPTRRDVLEEIEFVGQAKVVPTLAPLGQLGLGIRAAYERIGAMQGNRRDGEHLDAPRTDQLVETLEREGGLRAEHDERPIEQSDNNLVRLINSMILEAHARGVSDIHIECQPGREKVRIRFRRDGVLAPYLELPHTYRQAVVARIKVMCDLDISERRKPQDGKINFARFSQRHPLELRVATIPTTHGLEDVVLRLLASSKPLTMDELGMGAPQLAALREAVERPHGMVLCVGPTGSGKTTTLHSVLAHINTAERKIWTAEDPVEITQPGLRQVQVNPKIDWTFARALRAFLRADPDVIMVGEIRDQETAEIAIEASLTGHLVLSTLHTNSAAETVGRLLDMGCDPFNFADSLIAVLAQRLVRRLCPSCVRHRPLEAHEREALMDDYLRVLPPKQRPQRVELLSSWQTQYGLKGVLQHYEAPGCPDCEHSGLRGRAGLHELLMVSSGLRQLIQSGARAEEIQRQALMEGMHTLRQDGILKVLQGVSSLAEVRANTAH
ncbi:GspE/PulE family protein [Inhella sp.]|uniref:GspE/PulE family protein n=1 Tax=Inhella sp. TaxID=1921806 RepID=UPI0035B3192C